MLPQAHDRTVDASWRLAYRVFEDALDLAPQDRGAFARSATEDPEVLRLVLDLIGEAELELPGRDESSSEPEPDLEPGARFGDYEIGEKLGRGGMGEVYSARDCELGRMAALKLLAPDVAGTPKAVERLIREARAASALNHPNIVTIYEVIRVGGQIAVAMELVEGKSLRIYCGEAQPAVRVSDWGRQIAQALAAAHEHGIAHRDIKPENLMVRPDGYIKVLDFGLARQFESEEQGRDTQTQSSNRLRISEEHSLVNPSHGSNSSGILAGTLDYMAPEQVRAEPATSASDVFSFGVVLYQLATGAHPFRADSPIDTADAIAHTEARPPAALNREIPPALNSLLLAMLAKDPHQRPSATEVERRLSAIGPAIVERRPHGFRWLTAALVSCAIGGSAIWLLRERTLALKEPVMIQLTAQANENRVTAAALSPNGKTLAFGTLGGPIHLRRMNDGFTVRLNTPADLAIDRIAWFADGSRLLVSGTLANHSRGIWLVPISGGKPDLIAQDGKDGVPSPDGTRVALTSVDGSTIWVKGVEGGAARKIRAGGNISSFSSLVWLPDGKRIGYQRRDYAPLNGREVDPLPTRLEKNYRYSYESVDVATARLVASAKDVPMLSACALRDGRILFLRWVSLELIWSEQVWELRTDVQTGRVLGPPRPLTHGDDLALSSISASTDGKEVSVVWLKGSPNIYVADLLPRNSVPKLFNIRRLTFTEANDYPHAWTADNQSIIFESDRNVRGHNHYELYRQNIAQADAEPLCVSAGNNVLEQLSPDGKWVLYRSDQGNGKRRLMRVSADGGAPEPVRIDGELDEFRCSLQRGGACVLRTVENGQFVFHELDPVRGEGRELGRTSWSPSAVGDWDLSPDGLQVAIPNHDPRQANIKLIGLTGRRAGTNEKTIRLSGLSYLDEVVWSAGGRGWYVSVLTASGQALFYADEQGRTSELHVESLISLYVVPSRDGHRIAFPNWNLSSNAWLLRGL